MFHTLVLFVASISLTSAVILGTKGDYLNFPWVCYIKHEKERYPFSVCTIFSDKWMMTDADVWNDRSLVSGLETPYILHVNEKKPEIFVYAGISPLSSEENLQLHNVYVAKNHLLMTIESWAKEKFPNPKLYFEKNTKDFLDFEFDVPGVAVDAALVETFEGFSWSWHTLPVPLDYTNIDRIEDYIAKYRQALENIPHGVEECKIASLKWYPTKKGAGPEEVAELLWHEVTYIPLEACQDVYCAADPAYCMQYPYQDWHVCFKANMYTDMCQGDRGAALYCSQLGPGGVFAILSHAENCGFDGLPSVYTVINAFYRLWIAIKQPNDPIMHVAKVQYSSYPRPQTLTE